MIRCYWPPILFSSIAFTVYFFFKNDIIKKESAEKTSLMENEIKSKAEEIESLKKESAEKTSLIENEIKSKAEEIESFKKESAEKTSLMESEIKSKAEEIESLKKESAEKTSLIENEIKSKAEEIESFKKESAEKTSLMENEIKSKAEEIESFKKESAEKTSLMENEIKSKAEEIESLKKESAEKTSLMENEIKSKAEEIESLKKESEEKTSLMREMENEINSKAEEIETLKNDSYAKLAGMDDEINILKKSKDELMPRIAQLEDEPKAAKIRENCTPTEFTLHVKFTDLSKCNLEVGKNVFSEPTVSAGITWKMGVCKNGYRIYFYLQAEKEDSVEWLCPVIAELRVISQNSKEFVDRGKRKLIFDAEKYSNEVGYIRNNDEEFVVDDSITVAIAIKTFPRSIHEATKIPLRFQFSDISKLKQYEGLYSDPTKVEGITWKMSVHKVLERFEISLHAKKKDAVEWWCHVIVDLQLVSQTTGEMGYINREKTMYYAQNTCHWIGRISKEDLKGEKGFMKNDSIIVAMDIIALPFN